MYSLVSSPVLGFDLARLDGGPAAAEILLRALTLAPADLEVLAAALPDNSVRAALWLEVDIAAARQRTIRNLDGGDVDKALALLERAPIGTIDALLRCVRHDILDWTWTDVEGVPVQSELAARATSVICDAVVAMYLGELLPPKTRRRLAAGWVVASQALPERPVDLGPEQVAVTGLLGRLRDISSAELARLLSGADQIRKDPVSWAPAVHSASWAVHMSGRIRAAASAQLCLVRALDAGGVPVADRAAGAWSLLSGAVQALIVRDLLDTDTSHRLLAAYLVALGPAGIT
jgi:hypothetical protein